jgi:hypothetical protein
MMINIQQQRTPQQIQTPISSVQQSETASKLSLVAFVAAFEDGKSFNETDLATLGIDLNCQRPLLPMLHSVLSDAPLLTYSCHPLPDYYPRACATGLAQDKMAIFSDQTLLFIFETDTKSLLQKAVADELARRGWVFEEETERWISPSGNEWNVNEWKEIEAQIPALASADD